MPPQVVFTAILVRATRYPAAIRLEFLVDGLTVALEVFLREAGLATLGTNPNPLGSV